MCTKLWLVVAYIVFMENSILNRIVLFADVSMKPQLPPTSMKPLQPDKEAFLHKMLANVPQHRLTLVDALTSTEDLEKIAASLISWKRACAGLGISEEEEEEITRETPILDSQRWITLKYTQNFAPTNILEVHMLTSWLVPPSMLLACAYIAIPQGMFINTAISPAEAEIRFEGYPVTVPSTFNFDPSFIENVQTCSLRHSNLNVNIWNTVSLVRNIKVNECITIYQSIWIVCHFHRISSCPNVQAYCQFRCLHGVILYLRCWWAVATAWLILFPVSEWVS